MPSLDTRNLVPGLPQAVAVKRVSSRQSDALEMLLGLGKGAQAKALGVSLRLTKKGAIDAIALANQDLVVQITVEGDTTPSAAHNYAQHGLARVFNHPDHLLTGIGMMPILLLVYRQFGFHCQGVDLRSLQPRINGKNDLPPPGTMACSFLSPKSRPFPINALWYNQTNKDLCLRAWISARLASKLKNVHGVSRLRTELLKASHLACLSVQVMNVELLELAKPTHVDNDFDDVVINKKGEAVAHCSRFKTRIRPSMQTFVKINGDEARARPVGAHGKDSSLKIVAGAFKGKIKTLRVVGREEPTVAERERDAYIMRLLQGVDDLSRSPFIRHLWFPEGKFPSKTKLRPTAHPEFSSLNTSQRTVAAAMIDDSQPILPIQGPPGTGKTTTIAAALQYWQRMRQTVWVVAQSNVGVKNIARSIIKRGIKFKLIVSQEFYHEWHEHLYIGDLEDTLVFSNELSGSDFNPKTRIGSSPVILCTLAMLSNPALTNNGVFQHCPVERLVVDEASQIDTFEFMHLFHAFTKLRKMCLFGDPKQLPPYGKETAPMMKTIYDFPHLKNVTYFLDTQYRMPMELGQFISEAMYRSKLNSVHQTVGTACIRAINVRKGEEEKVGSTWKNLEEAHTVVNLVRHYYQKLTGDFCVITPYDAQRALITQLLEAANLPSNIVYNVDSFQGHEAPYVIVSAVRTTRPGFLSFDNRMNVMLSRCQRGMVLVTQRAFVEGGGKNTLLGKLVQRWEAAAGVKAVWADTMQVASGQANMPGAVGKQSTRLGGVVR